MDDSITAPDRQAQVLWLALLASVGQGMVVLLTLVLARSLGIASFEAYAVTAAAFTMAITVAPFGADKLSLRVLPPLLDRHDAGRVRGYLGWVARRSIFGTATCAATGLLWAAALEASPTTRAAVIVACFGLPAGVLVHVAMESLTAAGHATFAALAFRVVVPGTAMALTGAFFLAGRQSEVAALLAWGMGWMLGAALMLHRLAWAFPPEVQIAAPVFEVTTWRQAARPLFLYRITAAAMAQAAILALEWFGAPAADVGAYAAASGVAGLAIILAGATNRVYARDIALLLDRGDFATLADMSARRRRWLLPLLALFLLPTLAFAPQIMALFRPEFVLDGAPVLRLLAVAAAISVSLALAPTWLKYRGQNRKVFAALTVSALLQIALLVALVPLYGATGAGSAYAIAVTVMYGTLALTASQDLRRLRRASRLRR